MHNTTPLAEHAEPSSSTSIQNNNDNTHDVSPPLSPTSPDLSHDAIFARPSMMSFHTHLLLLTGAVWTTESMEMLLLSFISPSVQCTFSISSFHIALLTTAVGLGMLLGNLFWGYVSDTYGRRIAFILSTSLTAIFGFCSAIAPTFTFLLFSRFCVGLGVGGCLVAVTLLTEAAPSHKRGEYAVILAAFWSFGAVAEAAAAYLILTRVTTSSWRWLVAFTALPVTCVAFIAFRIHESVVWLQTKGRREEARQVLKRIGAIEADDIDVEEVGNFNDNYDNGKEVNRETTPLMSPSDIMENETEQGAEEQEDVRAMWMPGARHLSFILCFLYFISAFLYYGMILLQPQMLSLSKAEVSTNHHPQCITSIFPSSSSSHLLTSSLYNSAKQKLDFCSHPLTASDFSATFWSSVGELPGVFLSIPLVSLLGRRPLIIYSLLLLTVTFFLLQFCVSSLTQTFFFFIARGFSIGSFQTVILLCAEVYPPRFRTTAVGIAAACSRIGLLVTPFVAQVLTTLDVRIALVVYALVSFLGVIACIALPIETTGRIPFENMADLVQIVKQGEGNGDFKQDTSVSNVVRFFRWTARVDGQPRDQRGTLF